MPVAIVTGASSGIGRATAALFAEKGYTVYGMSRSGRCPEGVIPVVCDVTDAEATRAAVEEAAKNGLDVLVTCAGDGVSGSVEFMKTEDAKAQFEVLFFGTVNTVRAALPFMRKAGRGRIICISSVAGVCPIPFQVYYSAAKSAVNAFASGLANEVRRFGISVCALMPGDVNTGFTAARRKLHDGDDVYGGSITRSVAVMERDEEHGMKPESIARCVYRLAKKRRVANLYTAGAGYKALAFLARVLPKSAVNRVIGKLYVK